MPSPFVSPRPTASKPKVLQRRRARDCPQDGAVGACVGVGAVERLAHDQVGSVLALRVSELAHGPGSPVARLSARSRHLTDFTVRKALPKDADGFVRAHEEAWDATIGPIVGERSENSRRTTTASPVTAPVWLSLLRRPASGSPNTRGRSSGSPFERAPN